MRDQDKPQVPPWGTEPLTGSLVEFSYKYMKYEGPVSVSWLWLLTM
jgi:hypothetical protein